jgi:hypothetical protein
MEINLEITLMLLKYYYIQIKKRAYNGVRWSDRLSLDQPI